MLLIIEALLLILAALGQDHRAAVEGKIAPLDMAPNSADDQYKGCRENMANLVETEYLNKEIAAFKTFWQRGADYVREPKDDLKKNNLIAIYVYTDYGVYDDLKYAVYNDKEKYKDKTFTWYSLHFLLTEAIQILKRLQNKCYDTYRGTKDTYIYDDKDKEVRFGYFTSSSLDRSRTPFFGTKTCFKIHTCEGADITKYSKLPREKEVLIPPYEKFKVTAVKNRADQPDLWCETVFTLKSSGKTSELNCAVAPKDTAKL
ncbi:erythroblast NAD(P)(+)--arginine ADP-ribosyltransferase-like [Sinocyclocheilus anshuiensis]|uniref:erythroblast NAD(P)(+)--arginine ADP-ribosyltransferase-like n=1 Tax=Sinocyclocheilus anshuiensis TaxID=1608454 RepID=UPI0007B9C819|nr:PREDICTED: erythroblast NAD(P)(+)--arginine ADP-ribosyltransferase-like [Sinocyclocheilus anshuiensis]